jgi:hypothetical protein
MSPLLAPVFAQLVALQLGDRTEGRYAGYYGDERFEASTAPTVALNVDARRAAFNLSYSPSFTLSPLERQPRQLFVLHYGSVSASYRFHRTTLQLGSTLAIGSVNPLLLAIKGGPLVVAGGAVPGAPNANGGTRAPGTPATPGTSVVPGTVGSSGTTTSPAAIIITDAPDRKVRFYNSLTTLNLTHKLDKRTKVGALAGTNWSDGLDVRSRRIFQRLHAWFVGGSVAYTYKQSKRDAFVSDASLIKTWSSNDNEAATLNATETWTHDFGLRTRASAGVGFNLTRFTYTGGLAGFSLFPTALVSLAHVAPAGRGAFAFSGSAYSSPVLDPLRGAIDPRVGVLGSAGYTRKKFFVLTTGASTVSVGAPESRAYALNASQAEGRVGYHFGELTLVDAGARVVRQSYGGQAALPLSWATFVGVTFGYSIPLMGGR